jgi:large subunit ribosomal protein L4
MRQAALRSALSAKLADERIVVLDELAFSTPKTREMEQALIRLEVAESRVLVLMPGSDENVERSANNLPAVKLLRAGYLNVRDLLTYDYVVIPQAALSVIEQIWGQGQEEVA